MGFQVCSYAQPIVSAKSLSFQPADLTQVYSQPFSSLGLHDYLATALIKSTTRAAHGLQCILLFLSVSAVGLSSLHATRQYSTMNVCDVMWCDVMWCDVMWIDLMWCDVMWCPLPWPRGKGSTSGSQRTTCTQTPPPPPPTTRRRRRRPKKHFFLEFQRNMENFANPKPWETPWWLLSVL